jgi:cell division protein FtsN
MTEQKRSSPWVWISLFIIVGLFVTFILFLDQKIVKGSRQQAPPTKPEDSTSKPVIDFYSVLKERHFEVPEKQQEGIQPGPTGNTQDVPAKQYILQAGSFKSNRDADRRKAELALLGLEAAISKAEVEGTDYFRVELGPFQDDGLYSQVKNRLIMNNIRYISKSHQ